MKTGVLKFLILAGLVASCEPENTPPVASVYSIPATGDTATVFMLDGKNSSDKESPSFVLRYRWDVDADGIWDTEYTTRASFAARFSKTGYQKYFLEVADDDGGTAIAVDSVFILSPNRNLDTLTDPRDGRRYRIVKIGENWWMAENICFGQRVSHNTPPQNDELPEFLYFNDNVNSEHFGGLYSWEEANYYPRPNLYRDICPPGWRIPSSAQWSALFKAYSQPFGIVYYFGPSSIENLGIEMSGYYKYGDPNNPFEGEFKDERSGVRYWTSDFSGKDTTRYFNAISFSMDSWKFTSSFNRTEWVYHPQMGYIIGYRTPEACYVRCIRQ